MASGPITIPWKLSVDAQVWATGNRQENLRASSRKASGIAWGLFSFRPDTAAALALANAKAAVDLCGSLNCADWWRRFRKLPINGGRS